MGGSKDTGALRLTLDPEGLAAHCRELLDAELPSAALPHLYHLEHLELSGPVEERSAETSLLFGECYLRLGHFPQAEEAFVQALSRAGNKDPWTTLRVHVLMAETLLEAQRYPEAARSAETAALLLHDQGDPGQRARLCIVQCDLARLQGDYATADRFANEARAAAQTLGKVSLSGRVAMATAQVAWARGDLEGAARVLGRALDLLEAGGAKHLYGEACLLSGAFVGELVSRGETFPDNPLRLAAAQYLAQAQDLFAQSGSLLDIERVRQHFRLYGRRATDKVADEVIARRSEAVSLAHLELSQRVDALMPRLNEILARRPGRTDTTLEALQETIEAMWQEAVTFRTDLHARLISMSRGGDRLVDAAHAAVVERNHLREVLEGVRRLGTLSERDQLTREVVELAARVVNADRVVFALVNRQGDLTEREQLGMSGEGAYAWRFLAEQARRTGEPVLSAGAADGAPSGTGVPIPPSAYAGGAAVGSRSPSGSLLQDSADRPELGVAMAVPILQGKRVQGVIYADRVLRGGVFARRDLGLLEVVAVQVATLLESQRMNWALRVAARTREATMEAISDGVVAIDIDSRIRSVNSAAAKFFQMDRREIEGKTVQALPGLREAVAGLKDLEELEGRMIKLPGGEAVAGARLIRDDMDSPAGTVLTLTGMKRAQRTAHRMIGARARYTFGDILGRAAPFLEQVRLAEAAARSDVGVLVTGESGTGKEVMAQAIHNGSNRASGPFVGINCAAIPRDLLESELFGHEEGAFTGSKRGGQPGKFELASGGTVLLDEIGDMPLEMQAKMLRVLQERRYQRVGGQREHELDARIIATTNRDLEEMARQNHFRQDLLFRLKVIHLQLPALRERKEDIPLFVKHFLQRSARRLGKRLRGVSAHVLEAFTDYAWPGNIRELEYIIEGEVNLANDNLQELTQMPTALRPAGRRRRETLVGIPLAAVERRLSSGSMSLADAEKEMFVSAMTEHRGNVPAVAAALGISRGTVYNKLNKFNLDVKDFR